MSEKSFLEILSEKIEKQVRMDLSRGETTIFRSEIAKNPNEKTSNYQTTDQSSNRSTNENVDNFSESATETPVNDTVYNQWISQIPLGKIQFSTPKQKVFGRIYPVNTPRPKPQPERRKHVLSEKQKQAVVYFWGWQIRLQEDFTSQELKKAFRTLAHHLHPDKNNGKTSSFLELKSNYQCLLSVFN